MLRIAVNDANILIDFCKIGLIEELVQLNLEMYTTDFVANEIKNINQQRQIETILSSGKLHIGSFTTIELMTIIERNQLHPKLSIEDCSVWFYAEKQNAMVLTGDNRLRKIIEKHGLKVNGILWILDLLIEQNIISTSIAFDKLNLLMEQNPRLPTKLCEEKLELWKT